MADGGAVCCAQTDKKTLNTKVMMQEMKEIREKRRSAETTAKAVSVQTPFVFPLNPDITLNCQDECGCFDPPPPPNRCTAHSNQAMLSAYVCPVVSLSAISLRLVLAIKCQDSGCQPPAHSMRAVVSGCCLTFVMCLCSIVHQHIFEVMKLAFKEILTSEEQTQKAFVLWSTFVEPLFGLQPHKREEWELDQKQSNAAQQHHLRRNPSLRATAVSGESPMCNLWRQREEHPSSA